MKTLIISSVLLLGALISNISARASSLPAPPISSADTPTLWQEYENSARQIISLDRTLQLDAVKMRVDQVLTTRVKEVVTERSSQSSAQSMSGGLHLLFIHLSASESSASSSSRDVTSFIVKNAGEASQFDGKVTQQNIDLHAELLKWMEAHETEIVAFKQLGLENMAEAFELIRRGENVPAADVSAIATMLFKISFIGEHNVTRCIRTDYASRTATADSSSQASAKAGIFGILGGNFKESSEDHSYWHQVPHSETQCTSTTNEITVTPQESIYMVSYSLLDQKLAGWITAFDQIYLTQSKAQMFPTFGSPYYR